MDILYLLLPLSLVLLVVVIGIFGWAVQAGQFDGIEGEGLRILDDEGVDLDHGQSAAASSPEESSIRRTHGRPAPGGNTA